MRLADGRRIGCGILVNAAGPSAGRLAAHGRTRLPVEPRKRSVFVVDCPDAPAGMPLVADPSGIWVRPEGSGFITGYSPPQGARTAQPIRTTSSPDHALFEERAAGRRSRARIPAFER